MRVIDVAEGQASEIIALLKDLPARTKLAEAALGTARRSFGAAACIVASSSSIDQAPCEVPPGRVFPRRGYGCPDGKYALTARKLPDLEKCP